MKVTLIDYDPDAADKLIFTKQTRLRMSPNLMEEVKAWPEERKREELQYIANSIRSSHEFTSYTFLIEGVSRAFTHQLVRTRTASYAQQAMRVVRMEKYEFIMPERIKHNPSAKRIMDSVNDTIQRGYDELVEMGVMTEDARAILPTNIATNICARYNLRAFSDVVRSRAGGRTQSEYRDVVNGMIDAVLAVHPWAEAFIFPDYNRDYFGEIEAFAEKHFGDDLSTKGDLLKIVDRMRGIK